MHQKPAIYVNRIGCCEGSRVLWYNICRSSSLSIAKFNIVSGRYIFMPSFFSWKVMNFPTTCPLVYYRFLCNHFQSKNKSLSLPIFRKHLCSISWDITVVVNDAYYELSITYWIVQYFPQYTSKHNNYYKILCTMM